MLILFLYEKIYIEYENVDVGNPICRTLAPQVVYKNPGIGYNVRTFVQKSSMIMDD